MRPIVVIGVGNPLMGDEAIGLHVVRRLMELQHRFPHVEFLELGTSGMEVLHRIANRKKAIIIDCALMQASPGTICRFTPEDVRTCKKVSGLSFHEGDLLQILEISRLIRECPEIVVIFGIEPESVRPGQEMSACLRDRLDEYVNAVAEEIET